VFRQKVKVKVKLSLCFFLNWAPRHEGVLGSGGIAPCILDLGTRWRWVVSFMPRSLYPQGKSPWYSLDRRWWGERFQAPTGARTPDYPARSVWRKGRSKTISQTKARELFSQFKNSGCVLLHGINYIQNTKQSEYHTRVYPKVSGLATWSENCKWSSSLPLSAVVSLFCESVQWILSP
jgi:hypothetical protein